MPADTPVPTATHAPPPTAAPTPCPTALPAKTAPPTPAPEPPLSDVWGITPERIFDVRELEDKERQAVWRDKDPVILVGCRVRSPSSGLEYVFTSDGSFSAATYIVKVLGFFPVVMDSGRCFEMVVAFNSEEKDACYFVKYTELPYPTFMTECPSTAREQSVPMFLSVDVDAAVGQGNPDRIQARYDDAAHASRMREGTR